MILFLELLKERDVNSPLNILGLSVRIAYPRNIMPDVGVRQLMVIGIIVIINNHNNIEGYISKDQNLLTFLEI